MIALLAAWRWLRRQPVGTQSLLWGGHQCILHPLAVALAWRRLYGSWPRHPAIWLAILVHDWGYWGCPNMDGPEGKGHPDLGATLVERAFPDWVPHEHATPGRLFYYQSWHTWTACHSRSYARGLGFGQPPSPLQAPDKLATALLPVWLLGTLYALSGEWREYKARWLAHDDPPYPGRVDDGPYAFARQITGEWARFREAGADPGTPFA